MRWIVRREVKKVMSNAVDIDKLFRLVDRLYVGLLKDDAMILDALTSASRIFGADSCYLVAHDWQRNIPLLRYAHAPIDDYKLIHAYDEYYGRLNPFRNFIDQPENVGHSLLCQDIVDQDELLRSEFYNDFLKPVGWRYCMPSSFWKSGSVLGYIMMNRGPETLPFDPAVAAVMQRLLPHLASAYGMRDSFSDLYDSTERVLLRNEQQNAGLVFIGRDGRLGLMNDRARQVFAAMDGLSYKGGTLLAGGWDETRRIENLLTQAARRSDNPAELPVAKKLSVKRPSGRKPYILEIVPVFGREQFVARNDVVAALRIVDGEMSDGVHLAERFAEFRLTPAEIRLARYLMAGLRPKEIATRTGLSLNTIRVQQRNLYRKLGVSRHFELMQRLSPRWNMAQD